MTDTKTAFDAEMERAKTRLAVKQSAADALAKRARSAAREARKAALELEGTDRKRRDRARYVLGGVMVARLLRKEASWVHQWLNSAELTEKDRELVQSVLDVALSARTVEQENVGPLSMTAAPDAPASMAAYPSPGSATNTEHGDG